MPSKKEIWVCNFCGKEYEAQTAAIECERNHNRPDEVKVLYRVGDTQPCGVRVKLETGGYVVFGEEPGGRGN